MLVIDCVGAFFVPSLPGYWMVGAKNIYARCVSGWSVEGSKKEGWVSWFGLSIVVGAFILLVLKIC